MHPNRVQYGVTLELSSDYCRRSLTGGESHLLNIQFIGFGDVIVNVSGICSCGCEADQVLHQYIHTVYYCCLHCEQHNNISIVLPAFLAPKSPTIFVTFFDTY